MTNQEIYIMTFNKYLIAYDSFLCWNKLFFENVSLVEELNIGICCKNVLTSGRACEEFTKESCSTCIFSKSSNNYKKFIEDVVKTLLLIRPEDKTNRIRFLIEIFNNIIPITLATKYYEAKEEDFPYSITINSCIKTLTYFQGKGAINYRSRIHDFTVCAFDQQKVIDTSLLSCLEILEELE